MGDENYLSLWQQGHGILKSSLFKMEFFYRSVAGGNLITEDFWMIMLQSLLLVEIYESSGEEKWLHLGDQLTQKALELFGNPGHPLLLS
ncbi:MAG: hypothetical protein R2769_05740 [Saprospiraceae bacterium]